MTSGSPILGLVLLLSGPLAAPKDPCALLKTAEIQALDPKGQIGSGVATKPDAVGAVACEYTWGAGANVQGGKHYLHVIVGESSKFYPGVNAAMLKQGITMQAKSEPNGAVVPGVGDAAVVTSNAAIRVKTTALVKGLVLFVNYEASDAAAHKDHVIGLLKAAAGRL